MKNVTKAELDAALAVGERVRRTDAWKNLALGLGTSTDKAIQTYMGVTCLLTPEQLDATYNSDDLAARIVDALPEDALREGFEVKKEDDKDGAKKILERCRELGVREAVQQAAIWGRLFGGGAIMLGVPGSSAEAPLDDESAKDLRFLTVLGRDEMEIESTYTDPTKPKFGRPEIFTLHPAGAQGDPGAKIHESRLVFFGGVQTSRRTRQETKGWDLSALQRPYDALRDVATGWRGFVHLLTDLSQGVYKMSGLIDMIASGDPSALQTRMALVDQARSVARSLLMDADGEDFEYISRSVSGVDASVQQLWYRLAAAARMPVCILMGQAPAGLNATGASDLRWWYDQVRSYQTHTIKPALERIVRLVAQSEGLDAEGWEIDFPSLWQPSDAERAAHRLAVAQADAIYLDKAVLLPEEVAIARWGSGTYSDEMEIDVDARETMLEAELERAEDEALNPPDPAAVDPVTGETIDAPAGPPVPGKGQAPPGKQGRPQAPGAAKPPRARPPKP